MFVFQFFAAKFEIPTVPLITETALWEIFDFLPLSSKDKYLGKIAIPQKTRTLKITNNYKLAIPTIPLVSETTHMFVIQFFAAKFVILPVPLLIETAL